MDGLDWIQAKLVLQEQFTVLKKVNCNGLLVREEDYDWGDEELTCNVCDRSFLTPWDLDNHMIKRRHWG